MADIKVSELPDGNFNLNVTMSKAQAEFLQKYMAFCNSNLADDIQWRLWYALEGKDT